jgi:hypothetical protein
MAHRTMVPVLHIVIEGFVRLFGATPATLLARLTKITLSNHGCLAGPPELPANSFLQRRIVAGE